MKTVIVIFTNNYEYRGVGPRGGGELIDGKITARISYNLKVIKGHGIHLLNEK